MSMGASKTYSGIDTDRAWIRVHGRLADEGLIPDQDSISRVTPLSRRISVAAALVAVLAGWGLGYLLWPEGRGVELMTMRTEADNHTLVQTFGDGSIVYLAGNSVLRYPSVFAADSRKVTFEGEAFFDITERRGQPFVIETGKATVEVVGTAFNLKSSDEGFELIVEEGSVKVSVADLPGYHELVGEWEMLVGTGSSMEKFPVIDRTYLSWRMNRMQFKDEKLENIASVLSRNYNMQVYFGSDALRERRLTVTFADNDIETIARVIASGLGLDYELLPDPGILFSEKN